MLNNRFSTDRRLEAGCDEAGRGCLAGPVFAAAVILPPDYSNELLDDSKKLTARKRTTLRTIIEIEALSWKVASVTAGEIDRINILNASFLAMHLAVEQLNPAPQLLLIDGNRFKAYPGIPHHCIIKGDGIFLSIAAASVLAKTYRDEFMMKIHEEYPMYGWDKNKGYPTPEHQRAITKYGLSPWHRTSFHSKAQLKFRF